MAETHQSTGDRLPAPASADVDQRRVTQRGGAPPREATVRDEDLERGHQNVSSAFSICAWPFSSASSGLCWPLSAALTFL